MKYVSSLIILTFLTGCNAENITIPQTTSTSSTVTNTTSSTQPNIINSPTPTVTNNPFPVFNKFLYVLVNGLICIYPIDSSTHELIQPEMGNWCFRGYSTNNFISMTIDPSGKYFYAIDYNGTSLTNFMHQYAINDTTYKQYSSIIPITSLNPATTSITLRPGYMSFGSDGYLYIQDGSGGYIKNNQYAVSNGLPTLVFNNVIAPGTNFSNITSVTSGIETYTIDASSNTIFHYTNGVLQSSFQTLSQTGLTSLAIH